MKNFSAISRHQCLCLLHDVYVRKDLTGQGGCTLADFMDAEARRIYAEFSVVMDISAIQLHLLISAVSPNSEYQVIKGPRIGGESIYHVIDRDSLTTFLSTKHELENKLSKARLIGEPSAAITPSVGALFETDNIDGVGIVTKTRGLKLTITVSKVIKPTTSDNAYVATYEGAVHHLSRNGRTWKEAVAKVVSEVRKLTDQWENSNTETVEFYLDRDLSPRKKVISSVTTEPAVAREVDLDVTAFVATTDGALVRVEVSAPTGCMFEGLRKFNQMADRIRTHSLRELKEDSPVELKDGK